MSSRPAKRKVIAVDIDDVLADSARMFIELSNQHWGTELTVDDYDEDWTRLWRISREEVEVRASAYRDNLPAMQSLGAHEALRRLSEKYDLIIVTARPRIVQERTVRWIEEYYGGIFVEESIHFAGMWDVPDETSALKTKGGILKHLQADYHIDDQPKHCIGVF